MTEKNHTLSHFLVISITNEIRINKKPYEAC